MLVERPEDIWSQGHGRGRSAFVSFFYLVVPLAPPLLIVQALEERGAGHSIEERYQLARDRPYRSLHVDARIDPSANRRQQFDR